MVQPARKNSFLLIGPVLSTDRGNMGGATVSFALSCEYLKAENIAFEVVNTQRYSGPLYKVRNFLYLYVAITWQSRSHDVLFLNTSLPGVFYLTPLLSFLKWICGKKIVLRPFGGALARRHQQMPAFMSDLLIRLLSHFDVVFLQTRALCRYFEEKGLEIVQLPTARRANRKYQRSKFGGRFVFIGHIKESKGIDLLLEASQAIGPRATLHLYGPMVEKKYEFLMQRRELYRGSILPTETASVLAGYDVLMLPTHYSGEGYPGVIIEAYAQGMPVIATDWNEISEIVIEGKTGFLIPPRDSASLVKAIEQMAEKDYDVLSQRVTEFFLENHEWQRIGKKMMQDLASRGICASEIGEMVRVR